MIRYLQATWSVFWHYRYLLMNLVSRDIKVKYRRSTLGLLWSILNPLLMALVMSTMFSVFFRGLNGAGLQVVAATGQPPPFIVYVLTGQLIFACFSDSTNMAMDSVTGSAALIKKVYIPKYIFPLEKVMFGFVNTLFSLLSLVLIMLFTGASVSGWALLFFVPMAMLFVFNLGVGLILSAVVVFFRDIKHLYTVFTLALTYMTPIFYSETAFGDNQFLHILIRLNPVYWYVSLFRELVVYGSMPSFMQWVTPAVCAVVALGLGLVIFRNTQDDFILHI